MNHRHIQDKLEDCLIVGTSSAFAIAAVLFGVIKLWECML